MKLDRIGFVGWRGMVGSVLLQRMLAEDDFSLIAEPLFFTTSQVGQAAPNIGRETPPLADATDLDALAKMEVIITCQGSDYTNAVHSQLRSRGWQGYWIDSASALRMNDDSTIILDPVNRHIIEQGLANGQKDFIGSNCTVSLMLMALDGLFNADLIEWMSIMTYQAISGGGAVQMRELLTQMGDLHAAAAEQLAVPDSAILDMDKIVTDTMQSPQLPHANIGFPLAGSLLPWVDSEVGDGISREEWKGAMETNKILGRASAPIPLESTCVRIGVLRCHSQAFTVKLKKELPEEEIEQILEQGNDWVSVVANTRTETLARLTPAAVTGTLDIAIGRVRNLQFPNASGNGGFMSAFTVGDQLLWGAAEPLRRMLRILGQDVV